VSSTRYILVWAALIALTAVTVLTAGANLGRAAIVVVLVIAAGKSTLYEPGLAELIRRNLAEKRLSFTTDLARGVEAEIWRRGGGQSERRSAEETVGDGLSLAPTPGEARRVPPQGRDQSATRV
jgi:hypothetical protein